MDANNPGSPPITTSAAPLVKKGRRANKDGQVKYWKGMSALWMGITIAISGGIVAMTVGGAFSQIWFLIGLAIFLYGLCVESFVLAYRLIKER